MSDLADLLKSTPSPAVRAHQQLDALMARDPHGAEQILMLLQLMTGPRNPERLQEAIEQLCVVVLEPYSHQLTVTRT